VRVVIADDNLLLRASIASLLREAGMDVVAEAGGAEELLGAVDAHAARVRRQGLRAARETRERLPGIAIVILSEHVKAGHACWPRAPTGSATCLNSA